MSKNDLKIIIFGLIAIFALGLYISANSEDLNSDSGTTTHVDSRISDARAHAAKYPNIDFNGICLGGSDSNGWSLTMTDCAADETFVSL